MGVHGRFINFLFSLLTQYGQGKDALAPVYTRAILDGERAENSLKRMT